MLAQVPVVHQIQDEATGQEKDTVSEWTRYVYTHTHANTVIWMSTDARNSECKWSQVSVELWEWISLDRPNKTKQKKQIWIL